MQKVILFAQKQFFKNPKFLTCPKWPKTAILGIKSCVLIYWPKLGQNGPHHHFQRHFYCPYAKNLRCFIFFFGTLIFELLRTLKSDRFNHYCPFPINATYAGQCNQPCYKKNPQLLAVTIIKMVFALSSRNASTPMPNFFPVKARNS